MRYFSTLPRPFCEEDGGGGGTKPTFDELLKDNKEYQSEHDKKVEQAVKTNADKWQKKLDDALAKEREHLEALYNDKLTEQERLAKMNEEEKIAFERKKREDELSRREKELNLRELKAEAKSLLAEKGLSTAFADHLNYESAETVKASIENLATVWRTELQSGVDKKLEGINTSITDSQTEGDNKEIDPFEAKQNKYKKG